LINPLQYKHVGISSCLTQSQISWQAAENLNRRWNLKLPKFTGSIDQYTKSLEKQYSNKCVDVGNVNFNFFCVAFRKEVFVNELGGLDKDFEIGLGEDDYACHKIRSLGYKLYLVLDAFVYHHHRTTFKALNIKMDALRRKNVTTLRKKIKELDTSLV
jgi:GT2 family glycosyltransferase